MFKVFVKFNQAVIKEIEITKPETTFGRKPGNDIVIDNQAVSGFHGKIIKEGSSYFMEDLKSTNGTYVNGRKVTKIQLKDKDQIRVARHIIEVATDEPAPEKIPNSSMDDNKTSAVPPPSHTPPQPQQKEGMKQPSSPPAPAPSKAIDQHAILDQSHSEKSQPQSPTKAVIKVTSGRVGDQPDVELKDFVTYVGTSDKAAIKIKGFLAPDLAAAITRRPEGYFLKAIKQGYPKVNGNPVNEQALLESGALIEVGGTNLLFQIIEEKNK